MEINFIGKTSQLLGIISIALLSNHCNETSLKPQPKLDQPNLTTEEMKRLVLLDTNFAYSAANAKYDALTIASELDAEDAKRGIYTIRSIDKVYSLSIQDTIRYPKTDRSKKNDLGFHIFNFSDDNGFAIISGDKRAFGRLG